MTEELDKIDLSKLTTEELETLEETIVYELQHRDLQLMEKQHDNNQTT